MGICEWRPSSLGISNSCLILQSEHLTLPTTLLRTGLWVGTPGAEASPGWAAARLIILTVAISGRSYLSIKESSEHLSEHREPTRRRERVRNGGTLL